ncbi:UNC-50 [Pavlovales sp. CCMP2436]|nr:UNC-50 [Pavlovales sp. CCMP2436]|mmetsp:Transcript_23165/g.58808  ORF Transcript_23165/g.58808 Transcript_23165/m.58808 type:complete len:264 (-) Transcript_23165:152-943(-)
MQHTAGRYRGVGLQEYVHRIVNFREQCDFEYTFCTMLWLCIDPRRVYRNAEYHSRTKHQWARDDPGFIVVMVGLIVCSTTAWSLALGQWSVVSWVCNIAYEVLVDFVGLGLVAAGIAWLVTSGRAVAGSGERDSLESHGEEEYAQAQQLEFAYAFDVHCNSYFPLFLMLHVLHYLLLPLLLGSGHLSGLLSCSLYFWAVSYYTYLTFLGYNALPFLRHTEFIILPIGAFAILAILGVVVRFNPTVSSTQFFFAPETDEFEAGG